LPFDIWCLGETVLSCWENDRKTFLFFWEVKASLSQGVLKLWLELGIRIPKQLPCLANEQGNVPEKVMNLTSAPFVSASCCRCRRRGVGGCGFWEDGSRY